MEETVNRPKRVWFIFIWFVLGGVASLYQVYKIYWGNIDLPAGLQQPSGILDYLLALGFQLLSILAATLMFLRMPVNRWFFTFMLGFSVISTTYGVFTRGIPDPQFTTVAIFMLLSLGFYALVTWYAFTLLKTGYYKSTHNKLNQSGTSQSDAPV